MTSSNVSLMCAIRGPIMLITVGTLFAIDHFGPLRIAQTWPIILIVLGLMKLLERVGTKPPANPAGGGAS